MNKYLLIDGNNLAVRASFANQGLSTSDGIPTGVHFGFMQSLVKLKGLFHDCKFLIAWDGKSARRMKETTDAVARGIIPSAYKENRKKDEIPKPLADFYAQSDYLKRGIDSLGIPQIRIREYEADDIIASYCNKLKSNAKVICVTSDKDYYQLLERNVAVWDGMKNEMMDQDVFKKTFGIDPIRHVDVGAMMGDDGDNIFGIPSWGEKTALEEIAKYGSYENLYAEYKKKFKDILDKALTLDFSQDDFEMLKKVKSEKTKRPVYPEIYMSSPYIKLLKLFHNNDAKMSKKHMLALLFEERVALAYSLKKMDSDIEDLPDIEPFSVNKEKLMDYLNYYEMHSLVDEMNCFFE
jgi:DNA polymerase-1